MGQVDSTLKYGIYHSYQLMPNDWVYATIFDVQYLSHITAQCVVIKPAGDIAEGRFEVRWIDADGRPIGGTSKKYFTPTRLWKRHTATFEVPENAIKARVHYEGGTQGYHFACAMVEPGEIASAFSFEVASRLVYITNEGAYLGLLNAGQIVTGKMLSPTGKMWVDLDKPEIVMKGTDADLYIDPLNPLKVTDKNGNPLGGLMNIEGNIVLTSEYITTPTDPIVAASIGTVVDSDNISHTGFIVWAKKADGTYERSLLISPDQSGQLLRMYGPGFNTWFAMYGTAQGTIYLRTEHCGLSMIHGSTNLFIDNNDGKDEVFLSLATDGSETKASLSAKRNNTSYGEIGLDTGGPYAIRTNGTKVYL